MKSIMFSEQEVKATQNGTKTQLCRAMKIQPLGVLPMRIPNEWVILTSWNPPTGRPIRCQYGVPGDKLWVRETWRHGTSPRDEFGCAMFDFGSPHLITHPQSPDQEAIWCKQWRKRPPNHMPYWASRIQLEITKVRAIQVQDISEEEAIAQGVEFDTWDMAIVARNYAGKDKWFQSWAYGRPDYYPEDRLARASFMSLWDKINKKRGLGSATNPWIWIIDYEVTNDRS